MAAVVSGSKERDEAGGKKCWRYFCLANTSRKRD